MRDVRTVFVGLWVLTGVALIVLGLAALLDRPRFWRGVRRGAAVLAVGVVVLGVVALVAFDTLFETFHRLLFAGGSYTFDPSRIDSSSCSRSCSGRRPRWRSAW